MPKNTRQTVGPALFFFSNGHPQVLADPVQRVHTDRALGRPWRGYEDNIIQVVCDVADPCMIQAPIEGICHSVENIGNRAEAGWQHRVNIQLMVPLYCSILLPGVGGHQGGQERAYKLTHYQFLIVGSPCPPE